MRKLILPLILLFAAPAFAQEDAADRISRLERDINFLQRQVYRGGAPETAPASTTATSPVGIGQLREELRTLRGELEKVQYENKKHSEELKKLSTDVDFRLRAIEDKQAAAAAVVPAPESEAVAAPAPAEAIKPAEETAKVVPKETKPAVTGKDFPNSNEHYNHAFKLLNGKNYSGAATSFDDFVRKYPSDPLVSNAYYWLGESHYARGDFTRSAESFRKGFEANPDGQKAPDNLYKLGMSLAGIKRTNEACVVLAQIISKYGDTAPGTRDKAINERTQLQCK